MDRAGRQHSSKSRAGARFVVAVVAWWSVWAMSPPLALAAPGATQAVDGTQALGQRLGECLGREDPVCIRGVLEAVHGAEQRVPVLGAERIENCDALARGCDGGDVERGLLRHHAAVGGKPALARGGSFSGAGILGTGAGVTGDRVGAAGVDEREPAAHPHL